MKVLVGFDSIIPCIWRVSIPCFIVLSEGRRLFRQKDEESVENPIVEGGFQRRERLGRSVFSAKSNGFPIEILKNPQLFRFDRCEVVEGFSVTLWDIHVEIVIGDDTDGITRNV